MMIMSVPLTLINMQELQRRPGESARDHYKRLVQALSELREATRAAKLEASQESNEETARIVAERNKS